MVLPSDVGKIISELERCGHEAYAVGGCVRDSILGKSPADWDITTSASPTRIKALFPHTVDTGIAHGTVTVLLGGQSYEVTTYRIDGEYQDGRHPREVTFTSLLSEDLKRRDFTINAMAYNEKSGLVDLFHGMEDLKNKVIRCVGSPGERFSEDALRMLRAVRFCAQLDFTMEENTYAAICEHAASISKVSKERIMVELVKLLTSEHPEYMRQLYETGLTAQFLPEFDRMMETPQENKHHCYTVGEHTIHALMEVPPEKNLRLTMLLHDVAKPPTRTTDQKGQDHFYGHPALGAKMAVEILRRLKMDNDTISVVKQLVRWHDERPVIERGSIRKAMVDMGLECFPDIFAVKRADALAQSNYRRKEKLADIDAFEQLYTDILRSGECVRKKDLKIDGKDLMALGVPQGVVLGDLLQVLFDLVVEDPQRNRRDYLLQKAKHYIKNGDIPKRVSKS